MAVDGIGMVVRDLIRQIMAYAFPGSVVLVSVWYALFGFGALRDLADGLMFVIVPMGYGASVSTGFALHCVAIIFLFKHSDKAPDEYRRWVGDREARFQSFAPAPVRYHLSRLVGYWQMCTSLVLAGALSFFVLMVDIVIAVEAMTYIAVALVALTLFAGLTLGHFIMRDIVESYEVTVIDLYESGKLTATSGEA